ncbi:MAG: hypothetical protein IT373_13215 [Polyangiaceae bacterium]|nr:hypothetical protein [Polyangiaceae bacterium]
MNPTTTSTGSGGGCNDVPTAGEVDGEFFFALSAFLNPQKPVVFDSTLTTTQGANGLEYSLDLQPLAASDRTTPVGSVIHVGPLPVDADGTFDSALPELTVPGAANPITVGSDIVATITLHGELCGTADFICGPVTGNTTKPLPLNLASNPGSNFTMERVTTPGTYPEPPQINCAGALANPL